MALPDTPYFLFRCPLPYFISRQSLSLSPFILVCFFSVLLLFIHSISAILIQNELLVQQADPDGAERPGEESAAVRWQLCARENGHH